MHKFTPHQADELGHPMERLRGRLCLKGAWVADREDGDGVGAAAAAEGGSECRLAD